MVLAFIVIGLTVLIGAYIHDLANRVDHEYIDPFTSKYRISYTARKRSCYVALIGGVLIILGEIIYFVTKFITTI